VHTDLSKDPDNCGGCGKQVPPGWKCCRGVPIDVSNNINACGSCDNVCYGGVAYIYPPPPWGGKYDYKPECQGGQCRCPAGRTMCANPGGNPPYWCAPPGYSNCCPTFYPGTQNRYSCQPPKVCCSTGCCFP
jgi:hypothetical protein